jgi:hypothetical protein
MESLTPMLLLLVKNIVLSESIIDGHWQLIHAIESLTISWTWIFVIRIKLIIRVYSVHIVQKQRCPRNQSGCEKMWAENKGTNNSPSTSFLQIRTNYSNKYEKLEDTETGNWDIVLSSRPSKLKVLPCLIRLFLDKKQTDELINVVMIC